MYNLTEYADQNLHKDVFEGYDIEEFHSPSLQKEILEIRKMNRG